MKVRELEVGQRVGVAVMANNYGPDRSLGICRVVKRNKVRIVLERETDGHQFSFSSRYGHRLLGDGAVSYNTYVEPVEYQESREQRNLKREELDRAWSDLERAARRHNMREVLEITDRIKNLEFEFSKISL